MPVENGSGGSAGGGGGIAGFVGSGLLLSEHGDISVGRGSGSVL